MSLSLHILNIIRKAVSAQTLILLNSKIPRPMKVQVIALVYALVVRRLA